MTSFKVTFQQFWRDREIPGLATDRTFRDLSAKCHTEILSTMCNSDTSSYNSCYSHCHANRTNSELPILGDVFKIRVSQICTMFVSKILFISSFSSFPPFISILSLFLLHICLFLPYFFLSLL